jgi:hypothetical protein
MHEASGANDKPAKRKTSAELSAVTPSSHDKTASGVSFKRWSSLRYVTMTQMTENERHTSTIDKRIAELNQGPLRLLYLGSHPT